MCYRHTDREAHIRCQRCERPICPDCMRAASVGFHCPSCVSEGARTTRAGRTAYGGKVSGNPALTSFVLIGLNVAVWVAILATGGRGSRLVDLLGLFPTSVAYQDGTAVLGVSDGAYWQLVTSMFTHVDLLHLGFNMFALYLFGPQLEMLLGRARFLGLYFGSGLAGSVFVYWLAGIPSLTIGASGAIFGLFAAYLLIALRTGRNVTQLLVLLALNVFISLRGDISWQGHLGGFVGGLLIGSLFLFAPRPRRGLLHGVGLGLVTAVLLVAVVARTLVLG